MRSDSVVGEAREAHGPPRVLFIYPPVRLVAPPRVPPMGFLFMAAILEKAGIEVELLDLNARRLSLPHVMSELRRRHFDVVGIGGMTTVYYYIKLLSLMMKKERPDVPIIAGGSACSATPEVVLRNSGVDVVCIGEGEPVIVDLVKSLAAKQSVEHVPGIAYRDRTGQIIKTQARGRFEEWPPGLFPAHHLADMELYIQNNAVKYAHLPGMAERVRQLGLDPTMASRPVHVFSKRGCPFGCTFCYRNFGRKVVYSSVDHVIDYMVMLSDRYHTQHFVFGDELFNVNERWVLDFCDGLTQRNKRFLLSTSNGLRANCCSEVSLRRMREVGFYRVGIGIESFHDPSLAAMKKNQTAQQIKDAVHMIGRAGLLLNEGGMPFGYETDGWEAMRANVDALTALGFFTTGFSIPCPFPGTYLYEKAVASGAIRDEEGWLLELADRDVSDRVINLSGRPVEELTKIIVWGTDQLAINQLRPRYPLVAWALDRLQPLGRKVADIDVLGTLYQAKQTAQSMMRRGWLKEALAQAKAKRYVQVAFGDGKNLVGRDAVNCATLDTTTGDRPLLVEALRSLEKLGRAQPRPLPFL